MAANEVLARVAERCVLRPAGFHRRRRTGRGQSGPEAGQTTGPGSSHQATENQQGRNPGHRDGSQPEGKGDAEGKGDVTDIDRFRGEGASRACM